MSDPFDQTSGVNHQQPVVIRQGGSGIGLVLAALIIAGAAIYSVNVWSTTRRETAPGVKIQEGVEKLRESVQKKLESAQ